MPQETPSAELHPLREPIVRLLTHWGRATHICVSRLTIIGSDNGLPPDRRQAIIWTNAGILLIGPMGTNFSEILIKNYTFSFRKIHLKMSSGKWRPFCLGLNVLTGSAVSRTGLEGFGRYPVFTTVFTGKYRPGKNRFWTPKVGKTGKNTT